MREDMIFAILPAVSRTFALSINALLPHRARRALKTGRINAKTFARGDAALASDIALAYLLCRLLDTIEDDAALPAKKRASLLSSLGRALADDVYMKEALRELARIAPAIQATPAEKELLDNAAALFARLALRGNKASILRHAGEMAFGMAACVTDDPQGAIQSRADLDRYCHYVAGTVGAMLTELFIAYPLAITRNFPRKRAEILRGNMEAFARGLQLVNIIKDCCKDFAAGRCFIPAEMVRASGLSYAEFFSESNDAQRRAAMKPLLEAAAADIDRAGIYTRALPRRMRQARLFCILPIALARATLNLLAAPPKPGSDYTRIRISRHRVALLALLARPAAISNLCLTLLCSRKTRRRI
ncbi:MAG: squalene/phytoene synthase family protein [Spirochaetota bacterium]|jgi:farnesyl-diphosphate farnesyltransferase|nr:squalene/phytoene synthase family protein [Spirochaetota bacterium]